MIVEVVVVVRRLSVIHASHRHTQVHTCTRAEPFIVHYPGWRGGMDICKGLDSVYKYNGCTHSLE